MARRGTTNRNARGNVRDRAARRAWLLKTYAADDPVVEIRPLVRVTPPGYQRAPTCIYRSWPACRCYRCGMLLTDATLTVDRIIPGAKGGRYVRNNIRPACAGCNSETGARVRA